MSELFRHPINIFYYDYPHLYQRLQIHSVMYKKMPCQGEPLRGSEAIRD